MLGSAAMSASASTDAATVPVADIEFKSSETTKSAANVNSFSVGISTLGLTDGDVVVAQVITDYTPEYITRSVGHPGGSIAYEDQTTSGQPRMFVETMVYDSATWPSTLDYELSGADTETWMAIVSRWDNVHEVTILDDFDGAYDSTGSVNPSSPALNAGGSNLTAVACYGAREDDYNASGYPSGYTGIDIGESGGTTLACSGGQAYKTGISAGAVAAAAWTQDVANQNHGVHLLLAPAETGSAVISANVSGSATPFIGQEDVITGGKTLVVSIINDTFIAAGTGPIGTTAQSQTFLDGIDSAQSEAGGWDAIVKTNLTPGTDLVRTNDNTATITLPAFAGYSITADEVLTVPVQAAILTTSSSDITATPTITIAYDQFSGSDVNWLSEPALAGRAAIYSSGDTGSTTYELETIDGASGDAIELVDCSNITIKNMRIKNAGGGAIKLTRCSNITIYNNKITDTNGNDIILGHAVYCDDCGDNIVVKGNWMEDVASGVTLNQCDGVTGYRIFGNWCKNPNRSTTGDQGEFVFAQYCGPMDLWVYDNGCWGDPGTAFIEDWINMYRSYGTESLPIKIYNNTIHGSGTSGSGGGIMSCDVGSEGVSTAVGWIKVYNNTLINPGQYGIAITSGHDVMVYDNDIYAGASNPFIDICNVGIYLERWGTSSVAGSLHSCTVSGNNVVWFDTGYGTEVANEDNAKYFPSVGGWDGLAPNHGTLAEGNVVPIGWSTNQIGEANNPTWANEEGYNVLDWQTAWEYVA